MKADSINNTQTLSLTKKIIAACIWATVSLLFYTLHKTIPQFQETFNSFGAQLPMLTKLALSLAGTYKLISYICIIPIMFIFALNEVSVKTQKLYFRATIISFVFTAIYFLISLVSMYLPIFSLGQVV
jgi:type II secretory pathway component PulF